MLRFGLAFDGSPPFVERQIWASKKRSRPEAGLRRPRHQYRLGGCRKGVSSIFRSTKVDETLVVVEKKQGRRFQATTNTPRCTSLRVQQQNLSGKLIESNPPLCCISEHPNRFLPRAARSVWYLMITECYEEVTILRVGHNVAVALLEKACTMFLLIVFQNYSPSECMQRRMFWRLGSIAQEPDLPTHASPLLLCARVCCLDAVVFFPLSNPLAVRKRHSTFGRVPLCPARSTLYCWFCCGQILAASLYEDDKKKRRWRRR